jgi:deoxyadenosine/deoxycytidine kinase
VKKIIDNKQGKIIAVVGSPRSGKSFLTEILSKHYDANLFVEDVSTFPARIMEDLEKNIRPLERMLWFRNQLVDRYLHAIEQKNKGNHAVVDNFWLSWQLYIDTLAKGFEAELLYELSLFDQKMLEWPDVIIFLKVKESSIRNFIKMGGRKFDQSEKYIQEQILPVNKKHVEFFENNTIIPSKVIVVERDDMDFLDTKDLTKLIDMIDGV